MFVDAGVESKSYARNNQLNWQSPYASFSFNRGAEKFGLTIGGYIREGHSLATEFDEDSDERIVIDSWQSGREIELTASLNKFFEQIRYEYTTCQYEHETGLTSNNEKHDIAFINNFKVSPKTMIFSEFDYGFIDYPESQSDSDYSRYLLGVKGKISDKVNGLIKGGYSFRNFDDNNLEQKKSLYTQIDLIYDATQKLDFLLKVYNSYDTSTQTDVSSVKNTNLSLGCSYLPLASKKVLLKLIVDYSGTEYEADNRKDDVYSTNLTADYSLKKWLTVGCGYGFLNKASSLASSEYTTNTVTFKLTARF